MVESGFQKVRITPALPIETARARDAVNVHSHSQATGLAGHIEEKKILQRLVIGRRWLAAFYKFSVSRARFHFVRIIKVELTQIGSFEFHGHRAVFFLSLKRRGDKSLQVI